MIYRRQLLKAHLNVSCGVCRRRLMVGEPVVVFEPPSGARRLTCELCEERAREAGWDLGEPAAPAAAPARSEQRRLRFRNAAG